MEQKKQLPRLKGNLQQMKEESLKVLKYCKDNNLLSPLEWREPNPIKLTLKAKALMESHQKANQQSDQEV